MSIMFEILIYWKQIFPLAKAFKCATIWTMRDADGKFCYDNGVHTTNFTYLSIVPCTQNP